MPQDPNHRAGSSLPARRVAAGTGAPLAVRGLSVSFGGVQALHEVTFTGDVQILGIIGPNGAGKTTLVNCLTAFQSFDSGSISVAGISVDAASAWKLPRLGMARTFQHPRLLGVCTVGENLFLGPGGRSLRVRWAEDRFAAVREMVEPWLSKDVDQLPYGIRKVVDLARAALRARTVLLCDEPFSGLDQDSRTTMTSVLTTIADSGVTLIVIEHDFARLFSIAGKVVAIDFGRVIAEGPPSVVASDRAVAERFLGVL
jgi:ABC-type branched-subunit amino acid transport system ATPase component